MALGKAWALKFMGEYLPFFAIFYGIGIIAFGFFIRFYFARKRLEDTKKSLKMKDGKKGKRRNGKKN